MPHRLGLSYWHKVHLKLLEGVEDGELLRVAAAQVEVKEAAAHTLLHVCRVVRHSKLGELLRHHQRLGHNEVKHLGDSLTSVLLV